MSFVSPMIVAFCFFGRERRWWEASGSNWQALGTLIHNFNFHSFILSVCVIHNRRFSINFLCEWSNLFAVKWRTIPIITSQMCTDLNCIIASHLFYHQLSSSLSCTEQKIVEIFVFPVFPFFLMRFTYGISAEKISTGISLKRFNVERCFYSITGFVYA